jgi:NTP pyrophosphatase (non-canonical NTP hydrolase)
MDFATYQALAMRTSQWQPGDAEYRGERHRAYGAFTIAGESGEVVDALKKEIFSAHPSDGGRIKLELGDVCWGVACLCEVFDLKFHIVTERARRYRGLGPWMYVDTERSALTLAASAGRIADVIIDALPGHDANEMERRLAEVIASIGAIAEHLGFTLDEVLDANIAKLAARYPDGAYSHAASIARADEGPITANHRAIATVEKRGVSVVPGPVEGGE